MDKIEKIRQKIKELRELLEDHNYYLDNSEQALGYGLALDDIEQFLDTLSEEPDIPKFPETFEICLYDGRTPDSEKCTECSTTCSVRKEEPDKSLEEAAYKYSFDSRPSIYGQVDVIDAFKAGAEWQARQLLQGSPMPEDTVLFPKGVAEGRRLEREDMPKWRKIVGTGAPSGSIISYGRTHYLLYGDLDKLPKED